MRTRNEIEELKHAIEKRSKMTKNVKEKGKAGFELCKIFLLLHSPGPVNHERQFESLSNCSLY